MTLTVRTEVEGAANYEAEISLLGAALIDPITAAPLVTRSLQSSDFSYPPFATIHSAISTVVEAGAAPDPLAVQGELRSRGVWDSELDAELAQIVETVPTAANVVYHLAKVIRAITRRHLMKDLKRGADLTAALEAARRRLDLIPGEAVHTQTLTEILADPKAWDPPVTVVPRFAWESRVSALVAMQKLGKSTLLHAAAAVVSRGGEFLGEPVEVGRVLLVSLDEHPGDTARRLVRFQADGDRILIAGDLGRDRLDGLRRVVAETNPRLVVVDTLARLSIGAVRDPFSSVEWTAVLDAVTTTARESGAAICLLHHARKADGTFRDSTAIAAGVDAMLTMKRPADDRTRRTVDAEARWAVEPFDIRLIGDLGDPEAPLRFELAAGELSLDARIVLYVQANPGCSRRAVNQAVMGKATTIATTITRLLDRGALVDEGEGAGSALFVPMAAEGGKRPGSTWEAPPASPENPLGIRAEAVGKQSGRRVCFPPPIGGVGEAPREGTL